MNSLCSLPLYPCCSRQNAFSFWGFFMEVSITKLKGALWMGTKMSQEIGEFLLLFKFLFCLLWEEIQMWVAWSAFMPFIWRWLWILGRFIICIITHASSNIWNLFRSRSNPSVLNTIYKWVLTLTRQVWISLHLVVLFNFG